MCVQIFDEVEKRRQISMAMIYPFMQKLREAPFPAPGNTVEIKSFIPESGTEVRTKPCLLLTRVHLKFDGTDNKSSGYMKIYYADCLIMKCDDLNESSKE